MQHDMPRKMPDDIRLNRTLGPGKHCLSDIFLDIRSYGVLNAIFSDSRQVQTVIDNTAIYVADRPHYMYVDNDEGFITVGLNHLRQSQAYILYLDIIHELCHVKQHMQGRDLYDRSLAYVDRPTEIEAFAVTVQEARRLGLSDKDILRYLWVEWISPEEHARLARALRLPALPPEEFLPD